MSATKELTVEEVKRNYARKPQKIRYTKFENMVQEKQRRHQLQSKAAKRSAQTAAPVKKRRRRQRTLIDPVLGLPALSAWTTFKHGYKTIVPNDPSGSSSVTAGYLSVQVSLVPAGQGQTWI